VGDGSGFSFGIITVIKKRHELVHFLDNRNIQSALQLLLKSSLDCVYQVSKQYPLPYKPVPREKAALWYLQVWINIYKQ
jgi:hypothetical protein